MVDVAFRTDAIAITTEVGDNYGKLFREYWRHQMPCKMRLWITMQQHERRAAPTNASIYFSLF